MRKNVVAALSLLSAILLGATVLLGALFARATEAEQRFLRQLLVGELRQGALEGVMVDAVAKAAGLPARDVRRAVMLLGDLGAVAAAALAGGAAALAGFRLEVGRPVLPMLAQTTDGVGAALARADRLAEPVARLRGRVRKGAALALGLFPMAVWVTLAVTKLHALAVVTIVIFMPLVVVT